MASRVHVLHMKSIYSVFCLWKISLRTESAKILTLLCKNTVQEYGEYSLIPPDQSVSFKTEITTLSQFIIAFGSCVKNVNSVNT